MDLENDFMSGVFDHFFEDDSDDDDTKKGHIKVHIVDIKSVIQRLYLHPHTPWDRARRADMYKSFSNVPFTQVSSRVN
jgi:hypothetical protein